MSQKSQIILVTGFLGSGKTTLINRLIEQYRSKKIGLIINDFGQIAVDGMLLRQWVDKTKSNDSEIYEIANGSIFCACLSAELVKSLKHFAEIEPDVLLIETSGLSDPSTFAKILSENNLDQVYKLKASIGIVDAVKSLKLAQKIVAIEKQVTSSNIILINKIDLVTNEVLNEVTKFVRQLNPTALIIKTMYAQMDFSLLNFRRETAFDEKAVSCNTVKSRPGSIILPQKEISPSALDEYFQNIKDKIFRIKGFLKIGDDDYYISDNNGQLQIEKSKRPDGQYGLSVLAPQDQIPIISKYWTK